MNPPPKILVLWLAAGVGLVLLNAGIHVLLSRSHTSTGWLLSAGSLVLVAGAIGLAARKRR